MASESKPPAKGGPSNRDGTSNEDGTSNDGEPKPVKKLEKPSHLTFAARFEAVLQGSKAAASNMMSASFLHRVAAAPTAELKLNNERRALKRKANEMDAANGTATAPAQPTSNAITTAEAHSTIQGPLRFGARVERSDDADFPKAKQQQEHRAAELCKAMVDFSDIVDNDKSHLLDKGGHPGHPQRDGQDKGRAHQEQMLDNGVWLQTTADYDGQNTKYVGFGFNPNRPTISYTNDGVTKIRDVSQEKMELLAWDLLVRAATNYVDWNNEANNGREFDHDEYNHGDAFNGSPPAEALNARSRAFDKPERYNRIDDGFPVTDEEQQNLAAFLLIAILDTSIAIDNKGSHPRSAMKNIDLEEANVIAWMLPVSAAYPKPGQPFAVINS
ncbi:hypothetical protein QBC34DRAFT_471900 [Podospora aff. communis PSN243]|uniref:Uncharacterized protein n=1 Tax=Podospora aff. communis PSN243 TaxID=3040156 RepID=A0AAV9GCA4_9PEZI|nr:hypothetical protein QBC34DRAFT_471900 [Podospora aff. communis PSN243]